MFTINSQDLEKMVEISNYVDAWYLSASEAAWQIIQFNITERSPSIRSLSIHLPNRNLSQMICKNQVISTSSNLIRYFLRPLSPQFHDLLYINYNQQCIFYPTKFVQQNPTDFLEQESPNISRYIVRK